MAVRDNGKAGKPDFVQSMSTADGLIRLYIFPSSPLFSFAFLFILLPFRCSLLVRCHPLIARACLGLPLAPGDSTGSPRKKSIRRAANCSRDRPFLPKVRFAVVFDLLFPNPILLFPPRLLLSINYRAVSPLSLSVFDKRLNCSRGFRVTNFDAGSVNLV